METIKSKTVKGLRWSAMENIGCRLLSLAAFLVLARLLDQEAFGVVALAMAYVTFLELVVRVGFTEVIVQQQELSELDKDTAFWMSLFLGLVGLVLSWLLAPVAAGWSGNEELESILKWLAIGIIPLALTRVQHGVLARQMHFRSLAIRRLVGVGVGALAGVVCAISGLGVWSLVVQQLVTRLVDFLTLYWVVNWYPRIRFSTHSLGNMFHFSWKILGINIVHVSSSQADKFIIGHFLGVGALGVYVIGRRIIEVIMRLLSSVIGRVALSAFSRIQNEDRRLARASLAVAQLTFAVGFPILIFIAYAGADINLIIFGQKWEEAGGIMQLAAAASAVRIAALFISPMYKARGMPGKVLTATTIQVVFSILLAVGLADFGLEVMAAGWLAGEVIGAVILLGTLSSTHIISSSMLLTRYSHIVLAVIGGMALLLLTDGYIREFLHLQWSVIIMTFVLFLAGYIATMRVVSPGMFDKLREEASTILGNRVRAS